MQRDRPCQIDAKKDAKSTKSIMLQRLAALLSLLQAAYLTLEKLPKRQTTACHTNSSF